MQTTTVYDGRENLCALALSTRLHSCVRRGKNISLSYFGLAPNTDPTGLSSSVFLVAIARYWLDFRFKSSLPFLWFLLNQKNCGSHWRRSQRSKQCQKAWRSKSLDDACRWAWKGAHQPPCFLIKPSRQANSVIIKTTNQKTCIHTQKSSKPTLHSLGRFLGKSLNFREFKTFTISGNHSRSRHFPFLKTTHSVIPY